MTLARSEDVASLLAAHRIETIQYGQLGDRFQWTCECGERGFYVRAEAGADDRKAGDIEHRRHVAQALVREAL